MLPPNKEPSKLPMPLLEDCCCVVVPPPKREPNKLLVTLFADWEDWEVAPNILAKLERSNVSLLDCVWLAVVVAVFKLDSKDGAIAFRTLLTWFVVKPVSFAKVEIVVLWSFPKM